MKRIALTLTAALALAACSDGAGPGGQPGVSLSFSTRAPGAQPTAGFFASVMADTLMDGQNELIITQVEIVLREIELKRQEAFACDSSSSSGVDNDDCEEFEVGPTLVDLPLNGTTETMVTIDIPVGAYDELEFDFHKVSNDDPEDAAFRAQHPDMVGKSIRVRGTFNGDDFTFETDLNVEQEFDLVPPLVIDDATVSTNVTVLVNLARWYQDGSGTLLNPASGNKGGVNESIITENIKQSIEAFEDEDRDGDDSDES